MKKEVCAGTITYKDDEILLVHQVNGTVGFPKGHVENNESLKETAIRETKEETGIDVQIINDDSYKVTYSPKENVIKDVFYFKAKYITGEIIPQEKEIASAFWTNKSKVYDLLTFDNQKDLWKKINND